MLISSESCVMSCFCAPTTPTGRGITVGARRVLTFRPRGRSNAACMLHSSCLARAYVCLYGLRWLLGDSGMYIFALTHSACFIKQPICLLVVVFETPLKGKRGWDYPRRACETKRLTCQMRYLIPWWRDHGAKLSGNEWSTATRCEQADYYGLETLHSTIAAIRGPA